VPDVLSDNRNLWQWAGINFGEYNCMMLQKSLARLAATASASNVRLWGKINGTEKDFYIAEGTADAPPAGEDEDRNADLEPRGSGVNQFAYWVCNSPDENKWTALPDLSPSDVAAARSVKFHVTGDLERKIITNPFFLKREKHFIRAQIARISQSTTLVPKGVYRINEEQILEENLPEEGPVPVPSTKEMAKLANWVHYSKSILKCNRVTLLDVEAAEDEDPEVAKAKAEAKDPSEPMLKSIVNDQKVKGNCSAWTVRCYGD